MTLIALLALAFPITTPEQQFGHRIGDDYFLANNRQLTEYWTKLDAQSDRMKVFPIGKTEEGRTQLMAVISDPANMRQLERFRKIAQSLCLAKGLNDDSARKLASQGKAVVWIDGGLHASEVLGAQQLMETVYQLVSRDDSETRRILRDDIILCVLANPDGLDLCADWYMRSSDPLKRTMANLPRLYQKYIGHDNNRDFYASNQAETTNMNRVMYRQWFPQIVYNHHQTGPVGTVLFQPPFRDPFNYHFDPLVVSELDQVGANMMSRFIEEGKPGATMRSGSNYSTWWNGGLRTTCYFHNMIGLLTEAIGSPTPSSIPFTPDKLLPKGDLPFPIQPQIWHFRQSIDYSVTANYSVLDFASRHREQLLYNIYRMGANSILKGSQDTWTDTPSRVALAKAKGYAAMRAPDLRDARAYVIPATQDYGLVTRFVNSLLKVGVEVERARSPFAVGAASYPAGSYVVRCDQAFRPHILDMFEPQDHPNDLAYPGGPPVPPYDAAGYTLAFQMGIKFDRILDAAPQGDFETLHDPVSVEPSSYTLAFRRLKAGGGVNLDRSAGPVMPGGSGIQLRLPRVALWDRYGGSMPSGWIRWIFDTYEIPYTVVYAPDVDAGLAGKYDCLVLPSDATIAGREGREIDPSTIPEEFRGRLGSLSSVKSLPKLREFVESGGTILAIGPSTRIASQLGLDVKNALVGPDGTPLAREKFYIPGSVMRIRLDNTQPIAWGMPSEVDVMFDNDPAWLAGSGVERIGWYESEQTLRSGWALGQQYLKDSGAVLHARIGAGHVYLFAGEITYRGQPHETFKLLFNGLLLSAAGRSYTYCRK